MDLQGVLHRPRTLTAPQGVDESIKLDHFPGPTGQDTPDLGHLTSRWLHPTLSRLQLRPELPQNAKKHDTPQSPRRRLYRQPIDHFAAKLTV